MIKFNRHQTNYEPFTDGFKNGETKFLEIRSWQKRAFTKTIYSKENGFTTERMAQTVNGFIFKRVKQNLLRICD